MALASCRFVLLLFLLLALVAMVSAQPDSNGCDLLDLDQWLEESYNEFWATLANNELSRMVRAATPLPVPRGVCTDISKTNSPSRAYVDPSPLFHSLANDARAVANPVPNTMSIDRNPRRPIHGSPGSAQTYAAVAQRGKFQQEPPQVLPVPRQEAPEFFTPRQQTLSQPSPNVANAHLTGPSRRPTKTYAEAVRSPPAAQQTWPSSGDGTTCGYAQGYYDSSMPDQQNLLPGTITSNPNFYSGVTDPAETLQGWFSQPRTTRDRLGPRLDTSRLGPFSPSTHRSPASITSPSSSRLSNRRTKQQILNGVSKHRCHACHAGFDTKSDLKHHMRSHTPEQQRPHRCDACGKRFLYPKDLSRHSLVHLAKSLFCPFTSCKHAIKGFSRQDHLDRHLESQHPVDSVMQSSQPPSLFGP